MNSCSLCGLFTADTTCDIFMWQFCVLPFLSLQSAFFSYLHPPLLLLAGRLDADKFGREQAMGGQTRSLCVYIEGKETCWGGGEVASTDRVQWRPGGGVSAKKNEVCALVLWSSTALTDYNFWAALQTFQQCTAVISKYQRSLMVIICGRVQLRIANRCKKKTGSTPLPPKCCQFGWGEIGVIFSFSEGLTHPFAQSHHCGPQL